MKKTAHQPNLLTLSLFIFFLIISSAPIHARRFSPFSMPVGATATINGREVIKVTTTGKFVDLAWWKAKSNTTMQGWDDCASLTTPTGTNFTQGPTLIDVRDNKQYEIRKFADGKCWMVDNLMYGGETDACAGKTTFAGNGSAAPSNRFGTGTFGDCRDPRAGGSAPCTAGSTVCGYYYNWQAAMQHASAYYNTTYTGPTTNVQGLCPEGWHLSSSSEFNNLHSAAGLPQSGFWQANGSWKGLFSSYCDYNGSIYSQGYGVFWYSSQLNNHYANAFIIRTSSYVELSHYDYKSYGLTLRCIKN